MNNLNFTAQGESVGDREIINGRAYKEGSYTLDLERYWHEAVGLKYWLAGIVALGLLFGVLITLLATPLYQASARLEVSQVTADVTSLDSLEVDSQMSELQYLNTQYELLVSRFMAKRVMDAGNLSRNEAFREAFGVEEGVAQSRNIEKILFDNVNIGPIAQSSLVDVTFSSPDPAVSAEIANLWVQEFVAANYELRICVQVSQR